MKRLFVFMVLLPAFCFAANAGARRDSTKVPLRYEVNVGYATYPMYDASAFSSRFRTYELAWGNSASFDYIYGDYCGAEYITGVFSAEFNVRFKKWFTLNSQVNFDSIVRNTYSSMTGKRTGNLNSYMFSVLPYARFTYLNKPMVYLYSSVGLGLSIACEQNSYLTLYPAVQLVPIGVAVGKRLYGLFELGFGTVYCGCKAGIGYRF